jgi:hypothetical protein
VPSLPFACSALLGAVGNYYTLRQQVVVGTLSCSVVAAWLLVSHNFGFGYLLLLVSLGCSYYRIIYFAVDRELTCSLSANINNFCADLVVLGSFSGLLNLKLGEWVFHRYGVSGVIWLFILANSLFAYFTYQIPSTARAKPSVSMHMTWSQLVQSYCTVLRSFKSSPAIMLGLALCWLMAALLAFANLLLIIKFKTLSITTASYTNYLGVAMGASILSAVGFKLMVLQPNIKFHWWQSILAAMIGACLVAIGYAHTSSGLSMVYGLFQLAVSFWFLTQNSWWLNLLATSPQLRKLAPLGNGLLASFLYAATFIAEVSFPWCNQLGNHAKLFWWILASCAWLVAALARCAYSLLVAKSSSCGMGCGSS